jgi:hypothetical protein
VNTALLTAVFLVLQPLLQFLSSSFSKSVGHNCSGARLGMRADNQLSRWLGMKKSDTRASWYFHTISFVAGSISRTRENGNEWPSKYNLTLSAVNAQRYCAHHNGREVDRAKTVRCTSLGQPRNWHQMVTMIPVNPVSPPNSPLRNPMPPSAGTPNCIGLSAGRAKPYML